MPRNTVILRNISGGDLDVPVFDAIGNRTKINTQTLAAEATVAVNDITEGAQQLIDDGDLSTHIVADASLGRDKPFVAPTLGGLLGPLNRGYEWVDSELPAELNYDQIVGYDAGSQVAVLMTATTAAKKQRLFNADQGPLVYLDGVKDGDFTAVARFEDINDGMTDSPGEVRAGILVISEENPDHFCWLAIGESSDTGFGTAVPSAPDPVFLHHFQVSRDDANEDYGGTDHAYLDGGTTGTFDWEDTAVFRANNELAVSAGHVRTRATGSHDRATLRVRRLGRDILMDYFVDAGPFSTPLRVDNFFDGPVRVALFAHNDIVNSGTFLGAFVKDISLS